MSRRTLLILTLLLVLPLVAFGAALAWLAWSEAGLVWLWGEAVALTGERLTAERVEGRLADSVRISGIAYRDGGRLFTARSLQLTWNPLELLAGKVSLDSLAAEEVEVHLPVSAQTGGGEFPGFSIPFRLEIKRARVEGFTLYRGEDRYRVERGEGLVRLGPRRLELAPFVVSAPEGWIKLEGRVGSRGARARVDLATAWWFAGPGGVRWRGGGKIGGRLDALELEQRLDAPFEATVGGKVEWFDLPLRWDGRGRVKGFDLRRLQPDGRPLSATGRFRSRGTPERFAFDWKGELSDPTLGRWQLEALVERDRRLWRIPRLDARQSGGPATLHASGRWHAPRHLADLGREPGKVELLASWRDLTWRLGRQPLHSSSGTLSLEGGPDGYQGEADLTLGIGELPRFSGRLAFEGGREQATFHDTAVEWAGGRWGGGGQISWRDGITWEGDLAVEGFRPDALWPLPAGALAGRVATSGFWRRGAEWQARLNLSDVRGTIGTLPLGGTGELIWGPGALKFQDVTLLSSGARLDATGTLTQRLALEWSLSADDLSRVHPDAGGRLSAHGTLSGPLRDLRIEATGGGESLRWQSLTLRSMGLSIDAGGTGRDWRGVVEANGVEWEGREVAQGVSGNLSGRPESHRLTVSAAGSDFSLGLSAQGSLAGERWDSSIEDLHLLRRGLPELRQEQRAHLTVVRQPLEVTLEPLCLASAGGSTLCTTLAGSRDGGWHGWTTVHALPLALLDPLLNPFRVTLTGGLDGRVDFSYDGQRLSSDADLTSSSGGVSYLLPRGEVWQARYQSIHLAAHSGAEGSRLHADLSLAGDDFLKLNLALPGWKPGERLIPAQPIAGSLHTRLSHFGGLSALFPDLLVSGGALLGDLSLAGTVGLPEVGGAFRLADGTVTLPALGITVAQLRLTATSGGGGAVTFEGAGVSGPGEVRFRGNFSGLNGPDWVCNLRLEGERFEAARLPSVRIIASPAVNLTISHGLVTVSGVVEIPEGELNLPNFRETAAISPDVVIVGQEEEGQERKWRFQTDLQLLFGEQVQVRGYGFSGRLSGRLRLMEQAAGVTTAQGALQIVNGRYEAYGQSLTITRGRLLFANSPLNNPAVDLRATRVIEEADVTVGILASGRLQNPQLRLFSTPAMDDTEILSYLVLGRPLDTASQEEAGQLRRAALSLAGSGRLAKDVASQFGIDVVQVESGKRPEEASLVLGKYLSPRLYFQYAVGILGEAVNTLRLRYRLGESWVLEAVSGPQSGADILYTIEH